MSARVFNRRSFVAGAAATAVACASVAGAAQADEATSDQTTVETPAWLGEEPQIDTSDIAETTECDVVVVGGGTGGLVAAASAAEEGLEVVVLEKMTVGGGVRNHFGAPATRWQKELGVEIDKQEFLRDMVHYAANHCSQKIIETWFDNSSEMVEWYGDLLESKGYDLAHEYVPDNPEKQSIYKCWSTGHEPVFSGLDGTQSQGMGAQILTEYAESFGCQFLYETPMVRLVHDEDVVTGVIGQRDDGTYVQVNARKGVIVCTGGYARNMEMMRALQPQTLAMYSLNTAIPGTTGDGIKACLWAGAAMDETHSSMLFDRGAVKPDALGGADNEDAGMFWMGSHPWLKVNLNGERFCNDGGGLYDFVLHAAASEPGKTYCTIWDANYETYAQEADMHGCARLYPFENGAAPTFPMATIQEMNQGLIDDGYIQVADTIEELAEKLNIPADNLVATVERYNELYNKGVDEDFGQEGFRLQRVDTPPFYGVRQTGRQLCTMDGIIINEHIQALRADGTPIEGLYVTGNDSGCMFSMTYPSNVAGIAAGRTATFGRLAAKELAAK